MINRNLTYKSLAVAGANYLAFHLVVLDAIYWSYSFFLKRLKYELNLIHLNNILIIYTH